MAGMIELNLRPDRRVLRQFGGLALMGFGALAALAWFGALVFAFLPEAARPLTAAALAGLGAFAGLLSLVWPEANRPLYVGLSLVAFPIGFVLSYAILGLLFYGMIAPLGFVFRLVGDKGRDPLPEKPYWPSTRTCRGGVSSRSGKG